MGRIVLKAMMTVAICALFPTCAMKNKNGVCEEYKGLRCISGTRCSFDRERGCRVCACSRFDAIEEPPPDLEMPAKTK
ncbi:MAG: hypothetical protein V1754_15350 [Pseudomonadota bacterium]